MPNVCGLIFLLAFMGLQVGFLSTAHDITPTDGYPEVLKLGNIPVALLPYSEDNNRWPLLRMGLGLVVAWTYPIAMPLGELMVRARIARHPGMIVLSTAGTAAIVMLLISMTFSKWYWGYFFSPPQINLPNEHETTYGFWLMREKDDRWDCDLGASHGVKLIDTASTLPPNAIVDVQQTDFRYLWEDLKRSGIPDSQVHGKPIPFTFCGRIIEWHAPDGKWRLMDFGAFDYGEHNLHHHYQLLYKLTPQGTAHLFRLERYYSGPPEGIPRWFAIAVPPAIAAIFTTFVTALILIARKWGHVQRARARGFSVIGHVSMEQQAR